MPLYLAMTAAEVGCAENLPENMAWMACHFSPYGTGLSNLPRDLPKGSMLILNDRTPICGHDPERIAEQLTESVSTLGCSGVLLDLQRPHVSETEQLCDHLVKALSCPVGVTEFYAKGLDCPVFLSPLPPGTTLERHIKPWEGRELWLEVVTDVRTAIVTETGCQWTTDPDFQESQWFEEPHLHCRYCWSHDEKQAVVTFQRTAAHFPALLEEAEKLGITRAVGLYQQFK